MRRIVASWAGLVAICAAQAGCNLGLEERSANSGGALGGAPADAPAGATSPAQGVAPAADKAQIRVVHACADAPAVDVYVQGTRTPVVANVKYGEASGWLAVPPGTYVFEVRAAGASADDPPVFTTPSLTLAAGQLISAIAAGLLTSTSPDDAFRVLAVAERFDPVPAGDVRVRVVHAGADAPTVDLDVGNDDPKAPEIAGLVRFTDTPAGGVALPANRALRIGVDKDGAVVTGFTTPALPDGAQLLVIATGLLGRRASEPGGFALLAVGPDKSLGFIRQDPFVYALHGVPDAPAVDAFVGAQEIVSNLTFGELAGPIQVPPGSATIDVFAASNGTARPNEAPLGGATGTFEPGQAYLSIATGFAAGLRFITLRDDFTSSDDGKAQLRAVHGSPNAPTVDIGVAGDDGLDPVVFGGLSFTESSGVVRVAPATLPIGIAPAGDDANVVARFTVPVANQRAFVVAAGALGHGSQPLQLLVVDTNAPKWTVAQLFAH